ncbi:MAG: hypothetical protein ACR2LC_09425 [Pyrinomonadaceae bacterium]
MTARIFKLPSTYDERRDLLDGLAIMCARALGSPVRQADVARWSALEMPEMRRVHANWCKLVSAHESARTKANQVSTGIQNGLF